MIKNRWNWLLDDTRMEMKLTKLTVPQIINIILGYKRKMKPNFDKTTDDEIWWKWMKHDESINNHEHDIKMTIKEMNNDITKPRKSLYPWIDINPSISLITKSSHGIIDWYNVTSKGLV